METAAIILNGPGNLALDHVDLRDPVPGDLVVEIDHAGVSTGTEKLLWSGGMPDFPGMGYPLVPGYEAVGRVVEAAPGTGFRPGEKVFVPGADCYVDARGLFGANARRVVIAADRALRIDSSLCEEGALIALAATAYHALAAPGASDPDLIIGHGVLGRLMARIAIARGAPPPTVWETDPLRRGGTHDYEILDPEDDYRSDYGTIIDASGAEDILDIAISRLAKGGEVVLAGFYAKPLSFIYPPAFLREARIRVSAEWAVDDLLAIRSLIEMGSLALGGLVTHTAPAAAGAAAYQAAFSDPSCLKMIIDWKGHP
ncbi:MAG: chlorophyll synthesis pathway protein BchC [Pseudomonadota bacterium]